MPAARPGGLTRTTSASALCRALVVQLSPRLALTLEGASEACQGGTASRLRNKPLCNTKHYSRETQRRHEQCAHAEERAWELLEPGSRPRSGPVPRRGPSRKLCCGPCSSRRTRPFPGPRQPPHRHSCTDPCRNPSLLRPRRRQTRCGTCCGRLHSLRAGPPGTHHTT